MNNTFLEPKKYNPRDYTYNSGMPENDIIIQFVWHSAGEEYLEEINFMHLHPQEETNDWIEEEITLHMDDITADIPDKGVWIVTAQGKIWSESSWTDYGYEYDAGIEWEILAANKFPSFGALKRFWKYVKPTL